jgi:hypothetical protein
LSNSLMILLTSVVVGCCSPARLLLEALFTNVSKWVVKAASSSILCTIVLRFARIPRIFSGDAIGDAVSSECNIGTYLPSPPLLMGYELVDRNLAL